MSSSSSSTCSLTAGGAEEMGPEQASLSEPALSLRSLIRLPSDLCERLLANGEIAGKAAENAANAALMQTEAVGNLLQCQSLPSESKQLVMLHRAGRKHTLPELFGTGYLAGWWHAGFRQFSQVSACRFFAVDSRAMVAIAADETATRDSGEESAQAGPISHAPRAFAQAGEDLYPYRLHNVRGIELGAEAVGQAVPDNLPQIRLIFRDQLLRRSFVAGAQPI